MPIHKSITHPSGAKVLIWNITETEAQLEEGIVLNTLSRKRTQSMKDELHRKGFLSIRHLLKASGYTDDDLFYDAQGKPHLHDGMHISITHSFEFTGIIVATFPVGIDIEKIRDKITRIAPKFTKYEKLPDAATDFQNHITQLTKIWCMKESVYKLYATPGLSFKRNVYVADEQSTCIHEAQTTRYKNEFIPLPGFMCGYIIPLD